MINQSRETEGGRPSKSEAQRSGAVALLDAARLIAERLDVSALSPEQLQELQASINLLQEKLRLAEVSKEAHSSWQEGLMSLHENFKAFSQDFNRTGEIPREINSALKKLNAIVNGLLEDSEFMGSLGAMELVATINLQGLRRSCRQLNEDIGAYKLERISNSYSSSQGEARIMTHLSKIASDINFCLVHLAEPSLDE